MIKIFCILTIYLCFSANNSSAQTLDVGTALNYITDTADRICNVIKAEGSSTTIKASGAVDAELTGLAAKLAGAGLKGSGDITKDDYKNVLRTDLAKSIDDSAKCKLSVFDSLKDKLIPPPSTPIKKIVCTGEHEGNCPGSHDVFYTCGYFGSDAEIAKNVCDGIKQGFVRLKTVGGNKCGYALIEVTCSP